MINILRLPVSGGSTGDFLWQIVLTATMVIFQTSVLAESSEGTRRDGGIRKLTSTHLTLYTDLPSQADVDELPKVFDLAVPEWSKFFSYDTKLLDDWHVVACIINNKDRFGQSGLLPKDLPPFLNGFQLVDEIWIYEQPSEYYRRHLLLHEGTHSVMNRIFGRLGPAWYREGIAELVATHQYSDGKLKLAHFPSDKKKVEQWGRIRIVKDQIREGKIRSIQSIVGARPREFLNVESYAWSWALQVFAHHHPLFGQTFVNLQNEMYLSTDGVTHRFLQSYHANQHEFDSAWSLFLHHLDYGYDLKREIIAHKKTLIPLSKQIATTSIDVTMGWQSTGFVLPNNSVLDIVAGGRFRVAQDSQPWWCEPQGVTLEYYQGHPLGMLLAVVVNSKAADSVEAFTHPTAIGRRGQITTIRGGILYLRINERADKLEDNQGTISVKVKLKSAGL